MRSSPPLPTATDGAHATTTPDIAPHSVAVVAAETRRLERQLLAWGPMPRHRLVQRCGAHRWREGTFEEAVRQGLRTGQLRQLPLDWFAAGTRRDDRPPDASPADASPADASPADARTADAGPPDART